MSAVQHADAEIREQVLALEERRRRALIDVDMAELDAIFDDSLVHIHAPGLTQNKAELLEHIERRRSFIDITREDLQVRVIGDVAILTGRLTNRMRQPEGAPGDERTLDGMATQVLHRSADGWRFVNFQLTPFQSH
ncbi:nuclear transport factor 2 family protein [Salinibacterium sp. SYSU T00001]|uniref:nuclear transport factor 2 family protein n=1 Tax=Homoserinimonas sedimenticola TaxID=2986805 RepID=UPI002235F56C|nr:nuclear transport factor 2 family protein [Salinibacterium sedimenticola]MCW4385664.1 nuclear transport factor 2 family protein [Salinibacterium sedimenticola]